MYGERFIVGGHNVTFKKLLDKIATTLEVDKPSKTLSGFTASVAIRMEQMRAFFTGSKPLINKETYHITDQDLDYSFDKLHANYNFDKRSLDETIADIAADFKASFLQDQHFGLLDF